MTSTIEYPVNPHSDDANGIANILATLLSQNLQSYPNRVKAARKISRPVAVYNPDTDSAATIVFGTHEAIVHNDINGRPAVIVKATVDQILNVSQLPMKAGGLIPVGFFTKRGMSVLGDILKHSLVVKGLLIHTITALRLIALLSVVK